MSKSKKLKNESGATKMVRTGETSFTVHHDDGSYFECATDKSRLDSMPNKSLKGSGRLHFMGGFGERKPLVCDNCNERVHKVSVIQGRSLCQRCA